MIHPFTTTEALAVPLAEHFFIAGVEVSCLLEGQNVNTQPTSHVQSSSSPSREGEEECTEAGGAGLRPTSQCSILSDKRRSADRALHKNKRNSVILDHINPLSGTSMSEGDFDAALKRFAAERDTVFEEIEGQHAPNERLRVASASQRLSSPQSMHHLDKSLSNLRRRLSGINPLTRSSTSTRRASNRLSKRMSNYNNSVIPSPRSLQQDPQVHPLKRAYEPVLLDQYPRKEMVEECRGRKPFPDYVPMFVFPSDVTVLAADERPKSRYHGWTMTAGMLRFH